MFINDFDNIIEFDMNNVVLDENIASFVTENLGKIPKDGEVWETKFPFGFMSSSKIRKAIYLRDNDFGLVCIRVSTLKRDSSHTKPNTRYIVLNGIKYINPEVYQYSKIINHYSNQGFTKPVYFVANNVYQLGNVTPLEFKGKLDKATYQSVQTTFNKFKDERYNIIFNTLDWFLFLSLKNNPDTSYVHDLTEIESTMTANNTDIANAFHFVCNRWKIKHRIVRAINTKTNGIYWFVIFEHHSKWRYIHYMSDGNGGIISQQFISQSDAVHSYIVAYLVKYFNVNYNSIHTKVLSDDEVKLWDDGVDNQSSHNDIIKSINDKEISTKVEEMFILDMI